MTELMDKLVFSMFGKKNISECTVHELSQLAEQYPFFSTAQYLLAVKLKEEKDPRYQKQVSTASLYFNNPLWLNYLMLDHKKAEEKVVSGMPFVASPAVEEYNNDEMVIDNHKPWIKKEEDRKTPPEKETISLPDTTGPGTVNKTDLLFDPYHTVDYFASQGIKEIKEDKPADRFSQQLMSFTEWLRKIRQMQPQQIAALSTDTGSEEKVMQLAGHSLEDRKVVTEAMAEVWIKQGHPEKAIEIYQKLSLLNPSKSSYFAGLIENLKQS